MTISDPKSDHSKRDPDVTRQDFAYLARLELGAHRVLAVMVVLTALVAVVYKVVSTSGPWMLRVFLVISVLLFVAIVRDVLTRRARPLTFMLWMVWGGFVAYSLWWS